MVSDNKELLVLIVEDDPGDQKLIKAAIANQERGVRLMISPTGESAMDYLRMCKDETEKYKKPCLILLDLNMPGMDGKEFLREIKADDELCVIPVVVVTTSDSETDVQDCYRLQAAGYIQKSALPEEFNEVIKKMIRYWFLTSEVLKA